MDQSQQYLQNIIIEHLQNMHGSLCSTSLHGNKITADKDLEKLLSLKSETLRSLVCMLVLVTTDITNIYGIHLCKDGMTYNKTHVDLMPIRCTD